jgi:hypothetical protein
LDHADRHYIHARLAALLAESSKVSHANLAARIAMPLGRLGGATKRRRSASEAESNLLANND